MQRGRRRVGRRMSSFRCGYVYRSARDDVLYYNKLYLLTANVSGVAAVDYNAIAAWIAATLTPF